MKSETKTSRSGASLVRYSRAGDAFHYRWAARRCLRLVELNSPLRCVTIEGSKESEQAGEYAIDVAEYSESETYDETVAYYQLKHSTVRTMRNFVFSEFKPTLEQFGKRYTASVLNPLERRKPGSVTFSLVTNRRIADSIKQAVVALRAGKETPMRERVRAGDTTKRQGTPKFLHGIVTCRWRRRFRCAKRRIARRDGRLPPWCHRPE